MARWLDTHKHTAGICHKMNVLNQCFQLPIQETRVYWWRKPTKEHFGPPRQKQEEKKEETTTGQFWFMPCFDCLINWLNNDNKLAKTEMSQGWPAKETKTLDGRTSSLLKENTNVLSSLFYYLRIVPACDSKTVVWVEISQEADENGENSN